MALTPGNFSAVVVKIPAVGNPKSGGPFGSLSSKKKYLHITQFTSEEAVEVNRFKRLFESLIGCIKQLKLTTSCLNSDCSRSMSLSGTNS